MLPTDTAIYVLTVEIYHKNRKFHTNIVKKNMNRDTETDMDADISMDISPIG